MRRVVVLLLALLPGCFSDPPRNSGGDDTTGDDTGNASTSASTSSSTDDSTSSTSGGSSEGSTSQVESGTSSESGVSDSTGIAPGCGCDDVDVLFCEPFDGFDGGFADWSVPSGSAPPAQVEGPCGPAFQGRIMAGQEYAVITRAVPVTADINGVFMRGSLRVEPGCAAMGPHRLLQARVDQGKPLQYAYSTEYMLDPDGSTRVTQTTPVPPPTVHDLEAPALGTWVDFEFGLTGFDPSATPELTATVDGHSIMVERPALGVGPLQFTVVLGPFSPAAPELAGCTVDFDDVSVSLE